MPRENSRRQTRRRRGGARTSKTKATNQATMKKKYNKLLAKTTMAPFYLPKGKNNTGIAGLKKANLENIIRKYNTNNVDSFTYLKKMKKMLDRLGDQYESALNSSNNSKQFKVSQIILFVAMSVRDFMAKNKSALKSQDDILADLLGAMDINDGGNVNMSANSGSAGTNALIEKLINAYPDEPQNQIEVVEDFLEAFLDEQEDKQDEGANLDNYQAFADDLAGLFSDALKEAKKSFEAQAAEVATTAPSNTNVDDLISMFKKSTNLNL